MIDVLIPVFEGLRQTRQCIESVRRTTRADQCEVVVLDDATPNAGIRDYLETIAGQGVKVLRNPTNVGFVATANRGIELHPDRDVVILNSDTEVANDWLDRLSRAACGEAAVATATPFSNNATICSYPFEGWDGGIPGGLGLERLDRLVSETHAGVRRPIPTAVGFCMYIRREPLQRLGALDERRFGRGYGEENDFCLRATKAGYGHVLAADIFVFHEGAVSFGAEREARRASAAAALLEAHPEYGRLVHEFIVSDPLADLREAIDRARAACGHGEALAVLAERARERRAILAARHAAERLVGEHADHVARLLEGLAKAERLVEERNAQVATLELALPERDAEIARLREGLAYAEKLSFERLAELERIRGFWLWRFYHRAMSFAQPATARND